MTALPAADLPPERRSKPRKPSLQKNVSAETRRLKLVADESDDRPDSMTPSTFREARFSCVVCGSRSVGKVHPLCDRRRMSWLVKVDRRAKEPER